MTKYKKAILDIINNSYTHDTAEEIYIKLKAKMPNVVLATIYNNLNSLVKENLIRKITIEGQIDRYDRIIKHDHLICKRCGKLIDINFKDLTNILKANTNFEILGYDLKAYIICDECKKEVGNK